MIRDATEADLPVVLDIYNTSILTTTTWSDRPQSLPDREAWFRARQTAGDPVLVACDGDRVIGFAACADFRDTELWPGYRFTVEHTVHVADDHQGRGVGRALLEALVDRATDAGKHAMIAAVDGENSGSIAFHEAVGFVQVGRLAQVGRKFDRWLDLVLLERILDAPLADGDRVETLDGQLELPSPP